MLRCPHLLPLTSRFSYLQTGTGACPYDCDCFFPFAFRLSPFAFRLSPFTSPVSRLPSPLL